MYTTCLTKLRPEDVPKETRKSVFGLRISECHVTNMVSTAEQEYELFN